MIYKICQNISHLRVWSCIISYFSTNNDRIHVCCARKFLSYSHGRYIDVFRTVKSENQKSAAKNHSLACHLHVDQVDCMPGSI